MSYTLINKIVYIQLKRKPKAYSLTSTVEHQRSVISKKLFNANRGIVCIPSRLQLSSTDTIIKYCPLPNTTALSIFDTPLKELIFTHESAVAIV